MKHKDNRSGGRYSECREHAFLIVFIGKQRRWGETVKKKEEVGKQLEAETTLRLMEAKYDGARTK